MDRYNSREVELDNNSGEWVKYEDAKAEIVELEAEIKCNLTNLEYKDKVIAELKQECINTGLDLADANREMAYLKGRIYILNH